MRQDQARQGKMKQDELGPLQDALDPLQDTQDPLQDALDPTAGCTGPPTRCTGPLQDVLDPLQDALDPLLRAVGSNSEVVRTLVMIMGERNKCCEQSERKYFLIVMVQAILLHLGLNRFCYT